MSPAEIAAYVGAAAWFPQIVRWIYRSLTGPKLKIVSAPTVELGYTALGPIVNLTTAISADRRDALITRISLSATHEKGEERELTWRLLNETYSQIENLAGEYAEVSKKQSAIALKVSTLSLTEKLIGFRDIEFDAKFQELMSNILEHYNYLKGQNDKPEESLLKSKEFMLANEFFSNNMYWKEGSYVSTLRLRKFDLRDPTVRSFEFPFQRPMLKS